MTIDSSTHPKEVHAALVNSPEAWLLKADELLASGEMLWEKYRSINWSNWQAAPLELSGIDSVARMLRGMSIECMLKALWLRSGGQLGSDGGYHKIPDTNDHDLLTVCSKVESLSELSVSEEERDLLRRLSLSIVDGRYPVPKQASRDKMALKKNKQGATIFNKGWACPKDEDLFADLSSRIRHLIMRDTA